LSEPHDAVSISAEIEAMPFEKALTELEQIVNRLERGDVALEESLAIYARGEELKKRCEALLKQAESRIEKITLGPNGQPRGTEPLDVER
jgi:exodeoxyribonuclease VII small subunit